MVQVTIIVDGQKFVADKIEDNIENIVSSFYEHLNEFTSLKFELNDGSILLLNKDAIRRSIFIIKNE